MWARLTLAAWVAVVAALAGGAVAEATREDEDEGDAPDDPTPEADDQGDSSDRQLEQLRAEVAGLQQQLQATAGRADRLDELANAVEDLQARVPTDLEDEVEGIRAELAAMQAGSKQDDPEPGDDAHDDEHPDQE